MEFVGKIVTKDGLLSGVVQSYDASSGLFEIVYGNGDSEELDLSEVAALLEKAEAEPGLRKHGPGRRPKKRRRFDLIKLENRAGSSPFLRDLGTESLDLNDCFLDLNKDVNERVDLNAGFNLNLNEGFDLNHEEGDGVEKKKTCIDLNLDANGDVDESMNKGFGAEKRECGFDLNLGVDEEIKDESKTPNEDSSFANGTLQQVHVIDDMHVVVASNGIWNKGAVSGEDVRAGDAVDAGDDKVIKEDSPEVINETQGDERSTFNEGSGSGRRRRGRRKKLVNDSDALTSMPGTEILRDVKVIYGNQDDIVSSGKEGNSNHVRRRRGRPPRTSNSTPETTVAVDAHFVNEDCNMVIDGKRGDVEVACKEEAGGRRKRRRLSDHVIATPETTVLRRSARRVTAKNDVLTTVAVGAVNDLSVSPAVSALTEEKPMKLCCEWQEEPAVLPKKVQLPPSSHSLDLSGISVLDVFSVYSCLRSFSTLLFLSPFELEDFVAALKCNSSSILFDYIHLSILQTLKKHLEYLSNEGSESASNCLRSLNWDFLDLITWPVFMVEYLLIHGTEMKTGFNLSHVKLLKNDYCKQPVSLKIEILSCLCDALIEVETIRSELNRRSVVAESNLDFDRNISYGTLKTKRFGVGISGSSCLDEDALDDTSDWNSDECCLCKMDGNLICCDGCPNAYHSKCVGVSSDSLPEGDWFCPECAIDRHNPWIKARKSLRGAEPLGVDLYGQSYFSCCGYLLVSDSCETESTFKYYHRNDLNAIIEVLRSSGMIYSSILEAIFKHWDIDLNLYCASGNIRSRNHSNCFNACMLPAVLPISEAGAVKNETAGERKSDENIVTGCSGHHHIEVSKCVNQTCASSEGSETTQTSLENHNIKGEKSNCLSKSIEPSEDDCLTPTCLNTRNKDVIGSALNGYESSALDIINMDVSQLKPETCYMNYYSFGHVASSISEDLMRKTSDKIVEDSIKSEEEMISAQLKIISKKCAKFHWPNVHGLNDVVQKEKCGWCFSCRGSSDEPGCLVNLRLGHADVGKESATVVAGLQTKRKQKGHLIDIVSYLLEIESRLQGLLLGPWLNPQYSKLWRESALRVSSIESVKHLLLMLESNLSRLALSAEWLKHVDSLTTIGSASHIIMASSRASSKKRARCSEYDSNPSSSSSSGLVMLWWRGGRLSRQLFGWKRLPRSLASKAARQAGCIKVPGLLYPENSDFTKRARYAAWRAAVELSTTAEQLALQVRELDSNIRWDEIGNCHPLLMDKESRKSIRLFKKVIIRRKCVEADGTKYLLDFGKRRCIPQVVQKFGYVVEESSSERRRYWLSESHVPLYLLRSFEQKRIARQSGKVSSGNLSHAGVVMKPPLKKGGFSYLFAKADRSEYHQCGHCNKDVPVREAVSCQCCKGLFHKRHVRKSAGSISTRCEYTCHRCVGGKHMKNNSKTGKGSIRRGRKKKNSTATQRQKSEKASVGNSSLPLKNNKKISMNSRSLRSKKGKKVTVVVPLRRSPRKAKLKAVQNTKVKKRKKSKQMKPKKEADKKPTKCTSWHQKRTQAYHSYWFNGLQLTRKPDDERVMHFRSTRFIAPSESVIHDQPKCSLCFEAGYTSTCKYIACDMCKEWFHGDAFGLDAENSNRIIGFRCHKCRKCSSPVCPFVSVKRKCGFQMTAAENDVGNEISVEESDVIQQPTEVNLFQGSPRNEDHEGSPPADGSAQ